MVSMELITNNELVIFLSGLLGVEDPWITVSALLAFIALVLLIALIVNVSKKRGAKKEVRKLREYAMGLEALTNLPPLKFPEDEDSGESLIYTSTRKMQRIVLPGEEDAASSKDASPSKEADESIPAAVHNAILASVTGAKAAEAIKEEKANAHTNPDLSGRIPHI